MSTEQHQGRGGASRTPRDADEQRLVLDLHDLAAADVTAVGGKGAALGELARIPGVRTPPGFCVGTAVYRAAVTASPAVAERIAALERAPAAEVDRAGVLAAGVREAVAGLTIPAEAERAVRAALGRLGRDVACAVRSSATTEDGRAASSAGLHDSFLGVIGPDAVLAHIRRCWVSLFTDRAVADRRRRADAGTPEMAVVVQPVIAADASGVCFTADPVTSDRRVVAVEACLGLADALVAGRASADAWTVRDGEIEARRTARKPTATRLAAGGGTAEVDVPPARASRPALDDAQVTALARLARAIEAYAGGPRDIEWCLQGDVLVVVQSRPVTALFPIPERDDDALHVYVSVGHQQMMTDAMRQLGLSLFRMCALPPMHEAGGRLFVDVAPRLADPASREAVLRALGDSDPLVGDALRTLVERGDVAGATAPAPAAPAAGSTTAVPSPAAAAPSAPTASPPTAGADEVDPAVVGEVMRSTRASVAALREQLRPLRGTALVEAVVDDVRELRRILFHPRSHAAVMASHDARAWLDEHLGAWLGERGLADLLTRSAPSNVTSEMGLALLDVADAVRPHPGVVELLERAEDASFLEALPSVPGGAGARAAFEAFLGVHGARCVGEIDVTRPRWDDDPAALVPHVLANVRAFEAGAGARRFAAGRRAAERAEREVLARLAATPDGARRAREARAHVRRLRAFAGFREFPKHGMMLRFAIYRRALLGEAERLVATGVLGRPDDAFHLTVEELAHVVAAQRADHELIARRRQAFAAHEALEPPRVMTSHGEVVRGLHRRDDLPPGALPGLAVSAGTVEGRARIVQGPAEADLAAGDVLVTPFTDPSWTPAFVLAAGLVTEVGGLMTHGAVIAREYGLPAVVGVERATSRIRDGQRVRVDGTNGWVEVLPER